MQKDKRNAVFQNSSPTPVGAGAGASIGERNKKTAWGRRFSFQHYGVESIDGILRDLPFHSRRRLSPGNHSDTGSNSGNSGLKLSGADHQHTGKGGSNPE